MYDGSSTLLKYSKSELVKNIDEIQHPIFRAALNMFSISGVDIGVSSDIPAGMGLGSSSTFTVALIGLLQDFIGRQVPKSEIARIACEIEINILGEPIGKQDQYASAVGGLNLFRFNEDDSVDVKPLLLKLEDWAWLDEVLYLVQIPHVARSASEMLFEMKQHVDGNPKARDAVMELAELAVIGFQRIQKEGVRVLPELINRAWQLKKLSNPMATVAKAEPLISRGQEAGALAAKVLGAGGGGFILFMVEETNHLKFESEFIKEKVFRVHPDMYGVSTIYQGERK
jgi:D-glycero-alpha-D-manno-heptose-7-phosphate kinase